METKRKDRQIERERGLTIVVFFSTRDVNRIHPDNAEANPHSMTIVYHNGEANPHPSKRKKKTRVPLWSQVHSAPGPATTASELANPLGDRMSIHDVCANHSFVRGTCPQRPLHAPHHPRRLISISRALVEFVLACPPPHPSSFLRHPLLLFCLRKTS